ncbi:MAG: hypothetical protein EBV15_00315 [Bacteroidetes bacterium]|jgi:hypothetical protein|nr:hypothetical protein [Bacteroidota bacterium]
MLEEAIIKSISPVRINPYLIYQDNNLNKALLHYKANIKISQSFYPLLSILEVSLRNNFNNQLQKYFKNQCWFDNTVFMSLMNEHQKKQLQEAKKNTFSDPNKIIPELSFGFWTSLLDSRLEASLWKHLRLSFPHCPKHLRKRKTMSRKFTMFRKIRNRIFHHEPISWKRSVLIEYHDEMCEAIKWLNDSLYHWSIDCTDAKSVIENYRNIIK